MSYDNRKWVIVNNSAVTDEMISAAIQTSRSTLRHTVSGTDKVILKWDYLFHLLQVLKQLLKNQIIKKLIV